MKEWDTGVLSGKHTHNYGKSPFFIGKSTISMDHMQQLCLPEDMNIHLLVDCTSYFDVNRGIPRFLTYFDPLPNDFK
jgi:hypothetical protein